MHEPPPNTCLNSNLTNKLLKINTKTLLLCPILMHSLTKLYHLGQPAPGMPLTQENSYMLLPKMFTKLLK